MGVEEMFGDGVLAGGKDLRGSLGETFGELGVGEVLAGGLGGGLLAGGGGGLLAGGLGVGLLAGGGLLPGGRKGSGHLKLMRDFFVTGSMIAQSGCSCVVSLTSSNQNVLCVPTIVQPTSFQNVCKLFTLATACPSCGPSDGQPISPIQTGVFPARCLRPTNVPLKLSLALSIGSSCQ